MHFKVGQKVTFLHEEGEGEISKIIDNENVIVVDEHGFEHPYPISEIASIRGDLSHTIEGKPSDFSVKNMGKSKEQKQSKLMSYIQVKGNSWEVDLHSHAILDSESGLSNTELLRYQLDVFKSIFQMAIDKKIKKLNAIHGVGQGVLKNTIRDFLDGKHEIKYYDGEFRHYGKGATTIEFFPHGVFKENRYL